MAVYGLLVGIEDYSGTPLGSLSSASRDLSLMKRALTDHLKVPGENIRIPGEEEGLGAGREDMALSMASFQRLLQKDDALVFYFSGHGSGKSLIFPDGPVSLRSVIAFLGGLPCRSVLLILDCCHAGDFSVPERPLMDLEESLCAFAGRGIAVMASSAADQKSRLSDPGGASVFTRALCTAAGEKRLIRRGRISLQDLFDETAFRMDLWNRRHPDRAQHPIFRSAMGGTFFFPAGGQGEEKKTPFSFETPSCLAVCTKPMSASDARRLCVFVIPKESGKSGSGEEAPGDGALVRMTREIVSGVLMTSEEKLYPGESRLKGRKTEALWCYFAADQRDLRESLYFAVTVWAGREDLKRRYYREDRYSHVTEGILVQKNISYPMLKRLQASSMDREKCLSDYGKLLSGIVDLAEAFIRDLQETVNGVLSQDLLKERYGPWARRVRALYIRLSEAERPPEDLYEWTEGICDLAGWVLDLALYLDRESLKEERDLWLIRNALRHYYETMDALAGLEKEAGIRNTGEA